MGVSNSGLRSTKARSSSASHARVTSSSPRRAWSSSIPRSVKYMNRPLGERSLHQGTLLLQVNRRRAHRRRRGFRSGRLGESPAPAGLGLGKPMRQIESHKRPRALSEWLILYPAQLLDVLKTLQLLDDVLHRQGIE